MSSTSGGSGGSSRESKASVWQPALHLGAEQWVGLVNSGEVFIGDREQARRRVDAAAPTGLLPLLERPFDLVAAEIEEWESGQRRSHGFLARRLPLESLVLHALTSGSDYWAGLALRWVVAMPHVAGIVDALASLETATWAPQQLRHQARKTRRTLTAPDA